MLKLCLLLAVMKMLCTGGLSLAADSKDTAPVRIAAASSLQFVLNEIVDGYVKQTGNVAPQVVYGSSGNLFRQIMQGAPFDLFLSADIELINKLQNAKKTQGTAIQFGTDFLVLYANRDSALSIENFRARLDQVQNKAFKIAIANPRHAPFGRAAQQALESLDLWEKALPRLVFAEKVSQAAQFAVSGATEFAVVSRSLALSAALQEAGSFTLIPPQYYQPVVQSMVLITVAEPAQALFDFVQNSAAAAGTLQRFGLR